MILEKIKAEQILEKHLKEMLERIDHSYTSIEEMKGQPQWESVLNAMLEYRKEIDRVYKKELKKYFSE